MADKVPPPGWYEEFFERADLERAFELLGDQVHFYAETLRGRIRSMQLRVGDAWQHFDRAVSRASRASVTIPNLIRQFLLNLYLFDNAILEGPVRRDTRIPEARIPELPDQVIREYPEVAYVVELRQCAEGFLRLHLGEYARARSVFRDLTGSFKLPPDATLSFYYCGLAAAEHNLGLADAAARSLENAEFALQAGGCVLNQARLACVLEAFHSWLGNEDQAKSWRTFLDRVPCPDATKEVFLRRGQLLLERCAGQRCLLLL